MSLYILPENQKMIWDTISKVPLFQKMCNENRNGEQWFQNMIQIHYNKIQTNKVNKNDLRNLNKETIQTMLQDLKNRYSIKPVVSNNLFNNNSTFQSNTYTNDSIRTNTSETRGFILEQKQNTINSQFQTRQEEFGSLLNRPTVNEIDFREKIQEDKPIDNMDELIQKQLREREYEIQPKQIEQESKQEKEENIDIGVIEIQEKETKTVKWEDQHPNANNGQFSELKTMFETFMEKITIEIQELREEIFELKQEKKTILEEKNSTERMKNIMSKLRNIEEKNGNIESEVNISESIQ